MTKPEIAKAILERRNRMSHVVIPGEINAAIGADGLAEALSERWLVPDTEGGFLCVTNDLIKIEEMRTLAAIPVEQYKPQPISVTESHDLALAHTRRYNIQEVAAPGTGAPSPGLSAVAQPQPPPQPSAPAAPAAPPPAPAAGPGAASPFGIGSPVMVARQGVSANGMIEKLMPDGRYSVGYPPNVSNRPPGDNIFSKDELSAVPNAPRNAPVAA